MIAYRRRIVVALGHGVLFLWTLTFCVGSIGAIWAGRATTNAGLERSILEAAEQPEVRREFANALTANAMPENGRLVLRDAPAIGSAADATVTSPAFAEAVLLTVQDANTDRGPADPGGSVQEFGSGRAERLFAATLRRTRPDLADRLPRRSDPVLDTTETGVLVRSLRAGTRLAGFWPWLVAGSTVGAVAGLVVAKTWRRKLRWFGLVFAGVGVASNPARNRVISQLVGSVPTGPDRMLLNGVLGRASEPIALGRIAGLWALVILGGLMLAIVGRRNALNQPNVKPAGVPSTGRLTDPLRVVRQVLSVGPKWAWRAGLLGLGIAISAAILQQATSASRALRCLGLSQICDRTLDRVTLAATHNSMNNRTDGFVFPEHELNVRAQLESGIRGFLIDTHYGKPSTDGRIWTDLVGVDRAELIRSYGAAAVAAGEQARDALEEPKSKAGVYLCHNYCELGAVSLQTTLRVVRDFLDEHPAEIVLLDIQDQTTPADTVREFDRAGLSDQVFAPPKENKWPTIRQLISARTRLLVLTENEEGSAPWYRREYAEKMSDTPYSAIRIEDLTGCKRDRGPSDAKLLLLNHWIETFPPEPSSAKEANARSFIVKRAKTCLKERGRYPTVIAVNWSEVGGIISAVSELNQRVR